MTTNTSTCSLRLAACSSSTELASHSSGWSTAMFRFSAQSFTGGGVISIPRPCFLSGVVTTNDGTRPCFSRSSRKTAANYGVPKKANLVVFWIIIERSRLIGIQDAVEMVHFVLEDVRQKARRAARYFLPFFIIRTQHRFLRARDDAPFAAHRETSLVLLLFRARHFQDDGIDVDLVGWNSFELRATSFQRIGVRFVGCVTFVARDCTAGDDEEPQRHAELGGGERHAVLFFGKERFHFRDKLFYSDAAYVRGRDFTRNLPQGGIPMFGQNTTHTRNYNVSLA